MRVEVINTGTELLLGQVVNTHLAYFGDRLFELEMRVERQVAVPDGEAIGVALEAAFEEGAEVVMVTGGLGPTSDDLTREITAGLFGVELDLDEAVLEHIEARFRRRAGRVMPPENRRQAMVPRGAEVLWNPNGTAPGLYFPAAGERPHVFLLPGPPRELRPMFDDKVMPKLREIAGEAEARGCRNYRIVGVGESDLAENLEPRLREIGGLEIGYCTRYGEVDVRCIGAFGELEKAEAVVRSVYGDELVSARGEEMEEVIVSLLVDKGETLATAESCTGGTIANAITNVPGASAVFLAGLVTYANEAKVEFLGVDGATIEAKGAVSPEVASAMVAGCRARTGATHAISVTGIAGPGGGSEEKPVGTVYVGLASEGADIFLRRLYYETDRETFKRVVARTAMDLLRRRMLGIALPGGAG
ncbi:MAG: competence/damage-inducible protein A [Verrucomicrobiota bacterium]